MDLGFISCTKSKRDYPCKTSEMYSVSSLFRKSYAYAKEHYDQIAILSAKYGLLLSDDQIEPYDLTLKNMPIIQRKEWADTVFHQIMMRLKLDQIKRVFFHTGKEYREYLIPKLEKLGIQCNIPLEGLSYGKQLAWYNQQNKVVWQVLIKKITACMILTMEFNIRM